MSEIQNQINQLIENREMARMGGGQKAIDKQHEKGKYTARERIQMLLDEGSFEEFDMFVTHRCYDFGMEKKHTFGDGVVTGYGTIEGRLVYVFAQDFTVTAGSLSLSMSDKICKIMDMAMRNGAPCIGLNDSGGARIQEGVNALAGYANIFQRNVMCSGVIPQISAIFGPCAGGAVYSPALTDFIIMKKGSSNMFLTGPKVVKTVTGEDVTQEQLGGATMHTTKSGVAQFAVETEEEGIQLIRQLLSYMPQNNMEDTPMVVCTDQINRLEDSLNEIIPDNPNKPYDMYEVIGAIVDNGEFLEIQKDYSKNIIIGFARFNGQSVGIVANQPKYLAGVLDSNASRKGARFVRFCDAFSLPVVTFVNCPGFESIKSATKASAAYAEATTVKISVVTGKAIGSGYVALAGTGANADVVYALPDAVISPVNVEAAAFIMAPEVMNVATDKQAEVAQKFADENLSAYNAAQNGYVDGIVEEAQLRQTLISALDMLSGKRVSTLSKKHSTI